MTRIAVVSDTHNFVSKKVLDYVKSCDYTLHAGDICNERYADMFRMNCKRVYFVRGNNDGDVWARMLQKTQRFMIDGITFFMVHDLFDMGRDGARLLMNAQVVITGHTHIYSEKYTKEGQLWLNPGSCSISRTGVNTMAILTIENGRVAIEKICL